MGITNFDTIRANNYLGLPDFGGGASRSTGNTGAIWYASNSSILPQGGIDGSNGNSGESPLTPFETINYAIGRCVANRGDVIRVMPRHVEDVNSAAALAINVAGITIEFLGEGDSRGTISFSTVVGASLTCTAADVTFINPRFEAAIDALTGPISITGADCKIINGEYYDGTGIDTTDALIATAAADRLKIYGWKYYRGDEAGTQKQSHIQIGAADDVELYGIDIVGDFVEGCIENTTAWVGSRLEDFHLRNTNSSPSVGIKLAAAASGEAKNGTIILPSGVIYVSAVNQMNFNNVRGVNAVGQSSAFLVGDVGSHSLDPAIGSDNSNNRFASTNVTSNADGSVLEREEFIQVTLGAPVGASLSADIAAIQADIGNPSTRTNFQSLETMVGMPDAVNSNLDDMIRTGFDSTAITSNRDGSLMERTEYIIQQGGAEGGTVFQGACDAGMVGSTTAIVSADLAGYGDDFFNTKYYLQVIKNANSVGNAPEREVQQITDYVSATGTFTTNAFTVNVEASDNVLVIHESFVILGRDDANNVFATTNVVSNADGSLVERQEWVQAQVGSLVNTGGTATLGGIIGDVNNVTLATQISTIDTVVDAIQVDVGNPSARVNFSSLETMIGVPDAANSNVDDILRTGLDSTAIGSNADGSIIEREEYIQVQIGTLVNTGGTATLGGIIGDVANTSIESRLTTIESKIDTVDDFVDTEVAAIQTDIGDPSSRTNLQSLTAMLGNPDTAGETIYAASGTEFIVKKTLTSSAVVQAGVDITGLSSGGDLLIKDIYMNTNATGLATGTNFKIDTNNANGVTTIYQESVANLGANTTESLATGSVTSKSGVVLESGKKLIALSTVADCTGVGTITVFVVFQRVQGGATIAAA